VVASVTLMPPDGTPRRSLVTARDELISHGLDVTEVWHNETGKGRV
jgi:hypothetical protein